MARTLVWVGAGVSFVTLLASGLSHVARPRSLAQDLAAHGLSLSTANRVRRLLPFTELALVGYLGLAIASADSRTLGFALGGAGLLFSLVTAYASTRVRARPGVPCGCGILDAPLSRWVVIRGGVLATIALVGSAATIGAADPSPAGALDAVLLGLCAATIAVGVWLIPGALYGLRVGSVSRAR